MSSELVAVELQLKGYEGVMSDMRALDQMLNGFRGKKNKIEIQADLANTKKELLALKGALNEFQGEQAKVSKGGTAWHILQGYIEETNAKMKDCRQRANELQYALKNLSGKSFKQAFDWISSRMAHLGSAMQSAGNALTRLTTPFARFTSGMVMGAGYKALNKFTEGLESGFGRADTMRKYTRLMAEYETANYTAEQSRKELDESVQGLPIALDDAVSLAQRYTLSLGDMERGTKLAIATNNAFLASMSTENQRYQGMLQMQDLLNGKDLNSREWMSLGASMGKAINEIGLQLGYGKDELGEFRQELYAGNIATEDFLKALEEVGTGEGSLVKLAQESANTWEAFFSRIATASSRMVYGILTSMDELVNTASGGKFTTLNALFDDYLIGNIDKMTASIQGWIKAHPDEIIEFGKALKSIRWGSILQGFGQGLQEIANAITSFSKAFGGADLSWIGRWMVRGNILGNFLTIAGGLIKGSRGIVGLFGASAIKGVQTVKNIRKFGGIAGWLGSLAVGDDAKKAKEAIDTVAEVSPKMGKFSLGVSNLFKGWAEIATMVGGTALVGWGTFKAFKSMFKDLKEIADISSEINWGVASADLVAMGGFIATFIAVGTKVGQGLGLKGLAGGGIFAGLTAIFAGTFWADMAMIKRGFKAIKDATEYIQETNDNLNQLTTVSGVGGVKAKVKNAITLFNQITDLLQISRNNPITGESTSGLKELDKKSASTIKHVANSIKSMKTAIESINEISQIRVNIGGLTAVIPQFRVALTKIGNMLGELPPGMGSSETASNMTNMSTIMTDLKASLQSMIGTDGVLAMIPELVGKVNRMVHGGQLEGMISAMSKLGGSLKEVMNSLNFGGFDTGTMMSDLSNISSSLDQVNAIIEKINGLGKVEVNTEGTANIGMVIDNLKMAFSQDKVGELVGTVTAFVATVQAALQTIEQLNQEVEVDVTFKLSQGFYDSKKKVIDEIKKGKKQIQNQKGSISLSIPVRVWFNVITNAASALAKITKERWAVQRGATGQAGPITVGPGQSMGGLRTRSGVLYRSGGGSIFKPRGVDKIPAMLAEGEYVHKKQAVDFFGIDFMRKVNNMDVRGAMESLLTRAGTSVGIGRQSVVNNTVNNNQRITQNINTNNPNFAKVRMGRFVGAL